MQNGKGLGQKWIPVLLVVVAIAAGIVIRLLANQTYEYKGVLYENPQPAPAIVLPGTQGQFNLADQAGKIVLLYFGYTSCPDVCPSTLSDMKKALEDLGNQSSEVQVVFVTVDPDRDTLDKLGSYVTLFDPSFIGLSGTEDQLAPVWDSYGVYREIDTSSESMAGYLVNHTSRIYLIDLEGRLLLTYGFGVPPEDISEDIVHVLKTRSD